MSGGDSQPTERAVTKAAARAASDRERFGDRYEIRRVVGQGGMGVVYAAFDRVRACRVALKTMRRLDAGALYRSKNEFRALTDVSHPNLASLHELESEGEQTFFTMEYVEGVDFRTYVQRRAVFAGTDATISVHPEDEASSRRDGTGTTAPAPRGKTPCDVDRLRQALAQLVEGVAALHDCRKLHRDLKPSNVLVTPEGRVVILDFGLVSSLAPQLEQTIEYDVVGTPEYMSPEQASATDLTEASDWYSVGVMLYEALAGQRPYQGMDRGLGGKRYAVDPPRPREIADGVPDDLDALCMDLLQRDPELRPDARAIVACLTNTPISHDRSSSRFGVGRIASPVDAAFVGRERHLRELTDAFDTASGGRAVVAFVHGSSGMGKSLLVSRWLDALSARDAAVILSGRCYERESVPYKALDSVVDALSGHLRRLRRHDVEAILPLEIRALARIFPVLDRVEAVRDAPRRVHEIPDPQELRTRAMTAFRELVARMTVRRPLVVWIDDMQWGDIDSAALIQELLRPPMPPPVLLIASYRSEDASSALVAALREMHLPDADGGRDRDPRSVDAREIEVGPLDKNDVQELAMALLGRSDPLSRAHAASIADEAGGNPFFVDELVRHLDSVDAAGASSISATPAGAPKLRLDDVLYARASALPIDARSLLEIIAVAGKPLPRQTAANAASLEGEREISALALLRTGRLARSLRTRNQYDVETYHDRIRETVVAHLDAETRATLHLRVAKELAEQGSLDLDALVVHFREGGDLRKAADLAAMAAAKAVHALAFDRAAALWKSALDLPSLSAEAAYDLRWKLADALANAGRGVEAADAYLAAAEGAPPNARLELRRRAADQLLRYGRIAEGTRVLETVLATIGMTIETTPWVIFFYLVVNELRLRLRGLRFRARPESEVPPADLMRMDVLWSVFQTLSWIRPFVATLLQKRHILAALAAGEPRRVASALIADAIAASMQGVPMRRRTAALLTAAAEAVGRSGTPFEEAYLVCARGSAALFEGRFREARSHLDDSTDQFRDRCDGAFYESARAALMSAGALFYLGEIGEISRRSPSLAQAARQRGDRYLLTNVRLGLLNTVWLAADDPDRAEREIDDAMAQWGAPEEHVQHYHELLARVAIDLYRGNGVDAHARVTRRWPAIQRAHLHVIQLIRIESTHLRARATVAALARGGTSGPSQRALVDSARGDVRRLAREQVGWATGLSHLIEAAICTHQGQREQALDRLAHATGDFEGCDMSLFAAAARRRRGELLGGEDRLRLVEEANAKLRAQGVKEPTKYCEMLAPGFSRGG